MGMADGGHGIRFCKETSDSAVATVSPGVNPATSNTISMVKQQSFTGLKAVNDGRRQLDRMPSAMSFSLSMDLSLSGASAGSSQKMNSTLGAFESESNNIKDDIATFEG